MLAYHNDKNRKRKILEKLARHRSADRLVQGYGYWSHGKGCAVGCTIQSGDHREYETRFGIPANLARLEDAIFEWLDIETARAWPERFMSAIEPGADLSLVCWKFVHWLLTDSTINPGIDHDAARDVVKQCADAIAPLAEGRTFDAKIISDVGQKTYLAASEINAVLYGDAVSIRIKKESAEAVRIKNQALREAVKALDTAHHTACAAATEQRVNSVSIAHAAITAARSGEEPWLKMADKLISLIHEAAP